MKAKLVKALGRLRGMLPAKSECDLGEIDAGAYPELGRGYIDFIEYLDGNLCIEGWMFSKDCPFDGFLVKIGGTSYGQARLIEREDVQRAFPFIPTALRSGFSYKAPVPKEVFRDWSDIDIYGINNAEEVAKIGIGYRLDFRRSLPEPPPKLMRRVANVDAPITYWCRALGSFGEFTKAIRKYHGPKPIKRLLDWGCGCGRVTSLFLQHSNISEIFGCDIDREAVDWCTGNLQPGHFSSIEPYPPTRFDNNLFDVVLGYSVFTHLVRDLQLDWLKEMNRIMTPGGFFFASVHGEFAASFVPHVQNDVIRTGISDRLYDSNLDGIAPEGYYRGVFQTKAYTLREWGRYFKIIDYVDRGMGNFQDMVVMQKDE